MSEQEQPATVGPQPTSSDGATRLLSVLSACWRDGTLRAYLDEVPLEDVEAINGDWAIVARPDQVPPQVTNGWRTWLILGGRGAGKTRAGAEWVRAQALGIPPLATGPARRIALVGETMGDVRRVMIEGVSGILSVHGAAERPEWQSSLGRLVWPNGALAEVFSATEADGLRGPQFDAAWCDELAKWPEPERAWDMLQMALRLGADNEASRWNKALLDNSARPSGALVYAAANGQMTGDQFDRLKRELETTYQGARHAGRPLLLEGGLDWKPLSLSPKEMDFIEAKNAAAREIALAIGVPPMLLGIPGDNTYSNYQEANRVLWRQTVLPLVARTARALSAWLGGGVLDFRPDLDQVEALSPEREALWMRLDKASFLTRDEKRVAAGYSADSTRTLGDGRSSSQRAGTKGAELSR